MGLPFVVIEGVVFIADTAGNIADVETNAGGTTTNRLKTQGMILGHDGLFNCDVIFKNGRRALVTDATVTIEQLFGLDNIADGWFAIGTFEDCTGVGDVGDEVILDIAEGPCGAAEHPAVSVTTAVTAGMLAAAQPELALADQIIINLNLDANFKLQFKAKRVKNNGIVHVTSRVIGEMGERPAIFDFNPTATGTTVVTPFDFSLTRRGKGTSLSRDPLDPRVGILGISGTVNVLPGSIGKRFFEFFENGGSSDMLVDGSGTPIVFTIPLSATDDIFIQQVRFFGGGNGIKFGQFLSKAGSGGLTTGIEIAIKSDDEMLVLPMVHTTEDFKNVFSFPSGNDFRLDVQPGSDQFLAVLNLSVPFPLRKIDTFGAGNDDFIRITINDDILSGLNQLEATAIGFDQEA